MSTFAERFWAKVDRNGPAGCWIWTASTNGKGSRGYGIIRVGSTTTVAHRWAYTAIIGPIPSGMQLDHLCRVPRCVNPHHLEPVTPQENSRRSDAGRVAGARMRGRTACPQGHPYTVDNTTISGAGKRSCRTCNRAYLRKRAEAARSGQQSTPKRPVAECPQGHPYDETNTYISPEGDRHCRECRRVSRLAHYYRQVAP